MRNGIGVPSGGSPLSRSLPGPMDPSPPTSFKSFSLNMAALCMPPITGWSLLVIASCSTLEAPLQFGGAAFPMELRPRWGDPQAKAHRDTLGLSPPSASVIALHPSQLADSPPRTCIGESAWPPSSLGKGAEGPQGISHLCLSCPWCLWERPAMAQGSQARPTSSPSVPCAPALSPYSHRSGWSPRLALQGHVHPGWAGGEHTGTTGRLKVFQVGPAGRRGPAGTWRAGLAGLGQEGGRGSWSAGLGGSGEAISAVP